MWMTSGPKRKISMFFLWFLCDSCGTDRKESFQDDFPNLPLLLSVYNDLHRFWDTMSTDTTDPFQDFHRALVTSWKFTECLRRGAITLLMFLPSEWANAAEDFEAAILVSALYRNTGSEGYISLNPKQPSIGCLPIG